MKGLLAIRLSRKAVLIVGAALLGAGASGTAALYFFTDKIDLVQIAGASAPNGVACTVVQTEIVREADRFWVRKYVSVSGGDGPSRVRTAMRAALAVQEKEKPDLVQVAVVDAAGPVTRAAMRGRAVGANVVLIANPGTLPPDVAAAPFAARYTDGTAGADGMFYGQRIDMTVRDAEALAASISDRTPCIDPAAVESEPAAGAHGEPAA